MSELLEGKQAPERIYGVSQSQFSIARYYGWCKAFGETYHYDADTDSLVLVDVWNAQIKKDKEKAKQHIERELQKWKAAQDGFAF